MEDNIPFPVRINRYLALRGFATRKGADALISAGRVTINGKRAELGSKVTADDLVEVQGKSHEQSSYLYIAYYKPRGIITHSPTRGEKSIGDLIARKDLFPVGRLDKASEGLIILTNDGRITERLLHPRFSHEKEYEVVIQETVPPGAAAAMLAGVASEGDILQAKAVEKTSRNSLMIILTEGKKHEIRRMLAGVNLTVKSLRRVRIMNIRLGRLAPGEGRVLGGKELNQFLEMLDIVV